MGNDQAARTTDALAAALYDELRAMAAAYLSPEPDGHTLQPTALVNEALLKMLAQRPAAATDAGGGDGPASEDAVAGRIWANREQFLGVAAICMRRILVDHARARGRGKRGGGAVRLSLEE